MATTVRRSKNRLAPLPAPDHTIGHASLVEYLGSAAVMELIVVEFDFGAYRLEACLTWRSGRSVLVAARGDRVFKSLDTVAIYLRTIGSGHTLVRLELRT